MGYSVMVTLQILVLSLWVRIPLAQQNYTKMDKIKGYKGMLRNRCPAVVNYALKWQKAKERWIDHAYSNFIKIYVEKDERNHATRIILGIAKFYRNFEFDKSINWDDLTEEETKYWKRVSSWVKWFMKNYMYVENTYKASLNCGQDEFEIKKEIISTYLSTLLPKETEDEEIKIAKYEYVDKLVNFLIDCFNDRIR